MIRVNNRDEIAWEDGLTIAALLERLGHVRHSLVVKVNGEAVLPEEYAAYLVPDGANVLVIHMLGGG